MTQINLTQEQTKLIESLVDLLATTNNGLHERFSTVSGDALVTVTDIKRKKSFNIMEAVLMMREGKRFKNLECPELSAIWLEMGKFWCKTIEGEEREWNPGNVVVKDLLTEHFVLIQ